MTTTPFDDPVAFDRRWPRDDAIRNARADADPLLFVADHVMVADRRPGSLAFHASFGSDSPPGLIVIPDAPEELTTEQRYEFLEMVAENLCATGPLEGLGLVHHRMGPASITEIDAEWFRALMTSCGKRGVLCLGVIARTYSGAIVRL